jgi:hypothetical protein
MEIQRYIQYFGTERSKRFRKMFRNFSSSFKVLLSNVASIRLSGSVTLRFSIIAPSYRVDLSSPNSIDAVRPEPADRMMDSDITGTSDDTVSLQPPVPQHILTDQPRTTNVKTPPQ